MELSLRTPKEVMLACANRAREVRLAENLTQQALADRIGVAVGTIKRFEKTGEIQFHHLLKLALALGRLDEFEDLFHISEEPLSLLNLQEPKKRLRASSR